MAEASKTNDAFMREKLQNFAAFLESLVKSRKRDQRHADAMAKIAELRTLDTAVFLMHITQDMLPYAKNVRAYVAKMLADDAAFGGLASGGGNGSSIDELTPPELERLTRYITMFIEIVSQP